MKVSVSAPEDTGFWKKFEGESLDGQFPLDGYVGPSNAGATFVSRLSGHEEPVLIKILRTGSTGWERRIASWTLAKELEHPNLVRVYACGLGNLDGLRVAYAVTEYPDAKLTSVLMERCLTKVEARELLLSCAEALQYLHQKGLVHTHLEPADIVSANEIIKLSSDHLMKAGGRDGIARTADPYVAPEVASKGYTPASDVWSLGATLLQSVTGTLPETGREDAPPDPDVPYSDVLRHCLATKLVDRWTARQIVTALKKATPAPVRTPDNKEAPQSVPYKRSAPWTPVVQPARNPMMAVARYAIPVACILLLGYFWMGSVGARHPASPSAKAAPNVQPALSQPEQADRIKEKPNEPGLDTKPVAPSRSAPDGASIPPRRVWSVVVYTYSHPGSAHSKAAEINRKWPDLKAHVLVKGESAHLVVLGNGMDRNAALKLRNRAVAVGLPPDSYVQNF